MREEFKRLSKNEMVSICNRAGAVGAHKGMSPDQLFDLLESGEHDGPKDPIDWYRDRVIEWLKRNEGKVTIDCHKNCYLHSAVKVLQCYQRMTGGQRSERE